MFFRTNQTKKETTAHVTDGLPVAIYHRTLKKQQKDRIMPHWHPEFQFVWLLDGVLNYTVETEKIKLEPSSGLLINSSKLHSALPETETAAFICIDFSPNFINESFYQKEIAKIQNHPDFTCIPIQLNKSQQRLLKEFSVETERSFLPLYELLLGLLSQVTMEKITTTTYSSAIYPLLDYVHTNFQKPLKVSDIAQVISINKNKCTTLFKAYTGLSPIDYLIDYRLNESKNLLQQTELSISEICYSVGFNHLSYFITAFKKKYQCTPLQFRKQSSS
ncbi:helix-turn-helix domain-containing protein [Enterococcus olivae]